MTAVLITFIICVSIIIFTIIYMDYCSTNGVGIFTNRKYDRRIYELEKAMEELRKKLVGE